MIKGIIFDFDGLIFDTETLQYHVLNEIFQENGSELPLSRWQEEIGTYTGFMPFQYLEEQINRKVNQDELERKFNDLFQGKLTVEEARPGVEDYLKEAEELNLKIGLASSSNFKWVSNHLKQLNLYEYFQCIKTSDDVEFVKPDPALYVEAAKCLGLKVEECLVFEDSANGSLAAKKAGMHCVVVPNEVTRAMEFCKVEHKIESMADISLRELLRMLG
ncbi:HAD family hydrolase [Virgibacillus sp. FSP13]